MERDIILDRKLRNLTREINREDLFWKVLFYSIILASIILIIMKIYFLARFGLKSISSNYERHLTNIPIKDYYNTLPPVNINF